MCNSTDKIRNIKTVKKFKNIVQKVQNKWSYTETFWKTNGQGNKIKNSQHYS